MINNKYTVNDVSKITNISVHTIRYYDNQDLIPDVSRDRNHNRIFVDRSINWLYLIFALRQSGFSIKAIRNYIDMYQKGENTIPVRAKIIAEQEEILQQKIQELKKQLAIINSKKLYYNNLLQGKTDNIWVPEDWKDCLSNFSNLSKKKTISQTKSFLVK